VNRTSAAREAFEYDEPQASTSHLRIADQATDNATRYTHYQAIKRNLTKA
jgi:hypothetical protein